MTKSCRTGLGYILGFSALVSCVTSTPNEGAGGLFSVMTFNVRHRNELDPNRDKYPWTQRSDAVLNTILSENPDVLALQELNDQSWVGPDPVHDSVQSLVLDRLHGKYGMYMSSGDEALFVNDCVEEVGSVRNRTPKAILFKPERFRCLRSGTIRLPGEVSLTSGLRVSRYASWVILRRLPFGREYFILNAHIAAGDNEPIRLEAIAQLIEYTQEQRMYGGRKLPLVLAGDLNSKPDSAPIRTLLAELNLEDSYSGQGKTVNAWGTRTSRLDYVLHSQGIVTVGAQIVDYVGIAASDHFPFKVTLEAKD